MHKKITGFLTLSLLLSSGLNATSINAQTDVEDGFVPVSGELDEKNDFMINPNLTLDEEFEEEIIYIDLPEFQDNELPEEIEEQEEIKQDLEEIVRMPRFRMFSMPAPIVEEVKEQPVLKISKPGIGGFVNDGENYDIFDAPIGGRKISYVNSSRGYNGDAAIMDQQGDRYKIVIAGLEGWISTQALEYYGTDQILSVSHYQVNSNGDLIHYLGKGPHQTGYTVLNNGYAPNYLSKNKNYFSFDGHYFYDTVDKMLNDYKVGTRNNSINKNDPFYNYFQFLSYRAKSFITINDLDNFMKINGYTATIEEKHKTKESDIRNIPKNQSMLYGQSTHFIDQMNKFGANGAMTFSLAIHESDWGRSFLSRNRNNLFGHSAYDKYPGAADKYATIADAVHSHNTRFINWHYLDYTDTSNHYQGGMLGNKESGINVHYASDAYWGEKAAAHYLALDRAIGSKDYGKYVMGVKKDNQEVYMRKEPNTKSEKVMSMKAKNQSFPIYATVKGETINGSDQWYKIAPDHILTENRDMLKWQGESTREARYDFQNSYLYIHSSFVTKVNTPKSNPIPDPTGPHMKGDLNGDGRIDSRDMMVIRRHILGIEKMSAELSSRADLNNDGKNDSRDMMIIRRHILGIEKIRG